MAIQSLSEDQVQSMSREEKDAWWLANVYRGDMPQLTWRSAVTGFFLGGVLSATNLYVGAKTGWTLGVGLTSVILAFAMFRALSRVGLAHDFTILENNAMQSIATSAGYMTAPLISSLAAYMLIQNDALPWWQMMLWNIVLSVLGVLVAFPMKRRFINDEQQPFPEGRACGVVLDALYTGGEKIGLFKAKALAVAASIGGGIQFMMGEAYQTLIQVKLLQMKEVLFHIPEQIDVWYYKAVEAWGFPILRIAGVDIRDLGLRFSLDVAMIGAGGLMGPRVAISCFLGATLNYAVIAPWMISLGEIVPKKGVLAEGTAVFGRIHILNTWSLWWGISMMVVASLVALFAKPKVILSAFQGLFKGKRDKNEDVLKHIELPLSVSFIGIPLVTFVAVWMGYAWFGVNWWHGLLAIPLIILLTLIAANATALTSTTPTGSLSKITQFTFGALAPKNPATNLMTAGMTAEVASNASNLLMDIKPGYMLGAKPRQQAIGHVIGIVAGAIASTPLFFILFLDGWSPGTPIESKLITESFSMPSALQWKGVADLVAGTGAGLKISAIISMIIAAVVAAGMEITRVVTKGKKMPLSPLAIGLGVVIPFESTLMMFCGAMLFWWMHKRNEHKPGTSGHMLWVETQEPICAGLIAGAALIGIGDKLVEVFLL